MHMHVLIMLFVSHFGTPDQKYSLSYWIELLDLDTRKLWDKTRTQVKDFRSCQTFFDSILDGHIIATFAEAMGCETYRQLLGEMSKPNSDITARAKITEVIMPFIAHFNKVSFDWQYPEAQRDQEQENHILLLQHGLMLRYFIYAMRKGDSGRVLHPMSYFTAWFHGTDKRLYAHECYHLKACMKTIWSERLRSFVKRNWLINISGRKDAFVACDHLGEYVVREIKSLMHNNHNTATEIFLREVLSPLIFTLRTAQKTIMSECDYHPSDRSTRMSSHETIGVVADHLLEGRRCTKVEGRVAEFEAKDLHGIGIDRIGGDGGKRHQKYVNWVLKEYGCLGGPHTVSSESNPDPEASEIESEDIDGLVPGSVDRIGEILLDSEDEGDEEDQWISLNPDEVGLMEDD